MKGTVLITGVAGGIGRATAVLFAEEGWKVIGVDRQDAKADFMTRFVQADVAMEEIPRRLIEEIKQNEGELHALVNNAAVQICKVLEETTNEDWDTIMASNVRAPFALTREALPLLKASKGAIVNVSSVHAVATSAGIVAYAASKGALSALTRALAVELSPLGVRINSVLPGAVDTPMLRAGLSRGHVSGSLDDRMKQLSQRHVIGRIGQPLEIAQAILYLCDHDRSSFVTGQALVVDGGATARLSTE